MLEILFKARHFGLVVSGERLGPPGDLVLPEALVGLVQAPALGEDMVEARHVGAQRLDPQVDLLRRRFGASTPAADDQVLDSPVIAIGDALQTVEVGLDDRRDLRLASEDRQLDRDRAAELAAPTGGHFGPHSQAKLLFLTTAPLAGNSTRSLAEQGTFEGEVDLPPIGVDGAEVVGHVGIE